MSLYRRLLFVGSLAIVLAVALTLGVSDLRPPTAYASASNGQQINFSCAQPLNWITVSGGNQNGQQVTWHWQDQNNQFTESVETKGWWWKGTVNVTFNGWFAQYSANYNIPSSGSGIYTVYC